MSTRPRPRHYIPKAGLLAPYHAFSPRGEQIIALYREGRSTKSIRLQIGGSLGGIQVIVSQARQCGLLGPNARLTNGSNFAIPAKVSALLTIAANKRQMKVRNLAILLLRTIADKDLFDTILKG